MTKDLANIKKFHTKTSPTCGLYGSQAQSGNWCLDDKGKVASLGLLSKHFSYI